jgi:hypothetical protein
MTHYVVIILMSVATAAHSVLGCCWHHVHACTSCNSHVADIASESPSPEHGCHAHRCHAQHDEGATSEQAPIDDCKLTCDGACRFLPGGYRIQLDPPVASALVAPWTTTVLLGVSDGGAMDGRALPDPAAAELHVRIHLAHQLLLI